MKQRIQNILTRIPWGSVLLILLGAVLVIHPDFGSKAVVGVLGWILVLGGAAGLAAGILSWPLLGFGSVAGGVVSLMLGIFLLRNPLSLMSMLGILLGIFLASQGLSSLSDALRLRRTGSFWIPVLLWALILMGAGVVLIITPMTTSRMVMTVIGAVMIITGISKMVVRWRISHYEPPTGLDDGIIDADP